MALLTTKRKTQLEILCTLRFRLSGAFAFNDRVADLLYYLASDMGFSLFNSKSPIYISASLNASLQFCSALATLQLCNGHCLDAARVSGREVEPDIIAHNV